MTSFYGSSCANNGKGALNTPDKHVYDYFSVYCRLFESWQIHERDFDDRCIDALKDLKDSVADAVMDKFCEANMSRISNKIGFLMGTVHPVDVILLM